MPQRDGGRGGSSLGWLTFPLVLLTVMAGIAAMLPGRSRRKAKRVKMTEGLPRSLDDPRVKRAVEAAQHAYGDVRARLDLEKAQELGDEIAERVAALVELGKTELPPLTREMAERARLAAERARVEGAERSAELSERVKKDLAPAARVWANEAIEEAEEILAAARERAGDLSEQARKEYLPKASAGIGALGGLVAGGAATAAEMARARPFETRKSLVKGRGKQPSPWQRGRGRAGTALSRAGQQTKYAATESILILFWAGALGAVIYFGLLGEERRERVRAFLMGAFDQIQDVARDFQSDDDEFPVSTA